jgi:hypothetical protein
MLGDYGDRCLTIKSDDYKNQTFHVRLTKSKPPDWNALQQTPTIDHITFHGSHRRRCVHNQADFMALLAQNIRQHGGIQTINFTHCRIDEELVQLWDALIGNREDQETPVPTLVFFECRIKRRAAETLQLLLQRDSLKDLSFWSCDFDVRAGPIVEMALQSNQSLCSFGFHFDKNHDVPATVYTHIENGLRGMLHMNQNLVKLLWRFEYNDDGHDILWELSNCAAKNISALQSLEIWDSTIDLRMVQSIIRMGRLMHSFQHLTFYSCVFYCRAMKTFIKAFSRPYQTHPRFDTVKFEEVTVIANDGSGDLSLTTSFGNLQVQHLSLLHTFFTPRAWIRTMTEVGNNPCIQSLDLRDLMYDNDIGYYEVLRDVFLLPNRGPSELLLDLVLSEWSIEMLVRALQENTSIKALTVRRMSGADFLPLVQGLAHMRGLRRLALGCFDSEELVCQALQQSLEHNTTLCQLSMTSIDVNARRYLPRIRYLLATNLVGRHVLMIAPNVPLGLWARVLARSSKEADGIYFVLMEKPDIIHVESHLT